MPIDSFLEAVSSSSFRSFIQALLLLVFFFSLSLYPLFTTTFLTDQTFVDFLPATFSPRYRSLRDIRGVYSSLFYITHVDWDSPSRLYKYDVQGSLWSPANLPPHYSPSILFLACIICFLPHLPFYCWHK